MNLFTPQHQPLTLRPYQRDAVAAVFRPVRLIGMGAERLRAGEERLSLFVDPQRERQKRLDAVADRINQRFGKRAIHRGGGI